jgi:hypothetical protein
MQRIRGQTLSCLLAVLIQMEQDSTEQRSLPCYGYVMRRSRSVLPRLLMVRAIIRNSARILRIGLLGAHAYTFV